MNSNRARTIALHPLLWAVVGGLCLAVSQPKLSIAGLAWIAPGIILAAGLLRPAESFRTGYIAGLTVHLASLSWLLNIPVAWAPILGWIALSAYLALFSATWTWLACRLWPNQSAPTVSPGARALPEPFMGILPAASISGRAGADGTSPDVGRAQRIVWALQCAAIWVALEMLQGWLFTGFPWNFLGASQYRQLPLIQVASITGLHGVSFLIVWCSAAALGAAVLFKRNPASRAWRLDLIAPVIALVLVVMFGVARVFQARPSDRLLKVVMVQPSIPQKMKWDPAESTNNFQKLLRLSELALASKPDLLIWPEASVPDLLRYNKTINDAVTGLARKHGVWMIVGADDAEPRRDDPAGKAADYSNSAFLITPNGELAARYDKQRLVVFGEYIPLTRWLPFLKWFTPITSGFTPGRGASQFLMAGPRAKTSVLICFEDVFAFLARAAVEPDTDFLLNLTNNGWFGEGAAQWQHAATAVFRAVENGLPLVRCTNNGLTCWVDRFGAMHDVGVGEGDIYGEGFRTVKVPLLPEGRQRAPTFYHQHGDVFAWACGAWTLLLLVRLRLAKNASRE